MRIRTLKRKVNVVLLFVTISMTLLFGCYRNSQEEENKHIIPPENTNMELIGDYDIAFSHTGYFYDGTIEVGILSNKECSIYYTMDGSEPDQKQTQYQKEIKLPAKDEVKAYSIKAKAYFEDGTESDTIVHTYFVGNYVKDRFNTLVFSVTTDPYNLYDDEYGILIEGKLRRDHIKENPRDKIEPNDPANFNMRGRESEREVYLEVLQPDGTKITEMNAGIRTYGGWSRANLQKSIKIFARKEYDEVNNKFRYEFFPQKTAANGDGTKLDSFKRLVLRNCGNDNGFAFIRDELFQTLAAQAGYQDHQAVRPAAMFINGEYRGFFWLHEVYSDEYFEENYGDYTGSFEILEGGENYKSLDEDGENEYAIRDYEDMYTYAAKDLTKDENFNQLSELMDVENYLEYYALQVYIGNEDWPHNNYKTYRYYAADGEEYKEAPFDGKWRYLLHDLDFSFGIYGTKATTDNFSKYVGRNGEMKEEAPLFSQLMKRDDCKEIFIKKTVDLINGSFAPENLNRVLDEMHASRLSEQMNMYNKNLLADWVHQDQLEERLEAIRSYGSERAGYILTRYQEYFDLGDMYRLKVQPVQGAEIKINSFVTDDYFEGSYYSDYNTVISTVIPAGMELDYWMVNGEKVYEQELLITPAMIRDRKVEVNCFFKETTEKPHIIVSELSADGDEDYITLYNPYNEAVSTDGYTLTDDIEEPEKFILPTRIIAPGESLVILCGRDTELSGDAVDPNTEDKDSLYAEFGLKENETVVLFRQEEVIDTVKVPELKNNNPYQRDLNTMRFYEVENLN
ncbi:CotH kinase family protein [Mobilitalea sibirica]|uniref:CotH kinase family protein n=1 Tax=Mobilitalea sibirica TaxID=1462919 RepID=A0A8J7HE83_9FIRM|nr:CotH kinase family protein [Mobilitalea sibirica]MBH1941734.1 CotH kinase family protein [Mobilitalea sibirica]